MGSLPLLLPVMLWLCRCLASSVWPNLPPIISLLLGVTAPSVHLTGLEGSSTVKRSFLFSR